MLRRIADAPVALAHYAVGSVYVLAHLVTYERTIKRLQPTNA
ncbi:hypothetical protein [Sandaracinus amylolyticus]|nr:hypothetical protein [Sandaracinus amylolyticus]